MANCTVLLVVGSLEGSAQPYLGSAQSIFSRRLDHGGLKKGIAEVAGWGEVGGEDEDEQERGDEEKVSPGGRHVP